MKSVVILCCLVALANARPENLYSSQARDSSSHVDFIEILRDDRIPPEDGSYSFDFETANGITRSESGSRLNIEGNPVGQQGEVSFPFPDGQIFTLKFVANENGYQPESPWLPVAPEFPHPIPQFVLDQIEKAAREDAEAARSGSAPSYI